MDYRLLEALRDLRHAAHAKADEKRRDYREARALYKDGVYDAEDLHDEHIEMVRAYARLDALDSIFDVMGVDACVDA